MTDSSDSSVTGRMKEAAYRRMQEEATERHEVRKTVFGGGDTRDRIGELVKLGGDYLVEVHGSRGITWTTVVRGERTPFHHATQEVAVLHLIARRHTETEKDAYDAVFYAARVLGIPTE